MSLNSSGSWKILFQKAKFGAESLPCWRNLGPRLNLNRVCAVVKVHVHAKYRHAKCSGSLLTLRTSFFALSRNGAKPPNPVL